jgi:serine/threonine-protein kinase RsbW
MERGDSERIEITISSRFENIELVQVIAEHLCENAGVDEDGSHWIGMAVREAVANAIKHGNKLDVKKKVFATFVLDGPELEITIADEGEGFDP